MEDRRCNSSITILMLPWLAHGHISPYLELAKMLVKRDSDKLFRVLLCSSPANIKSIQPKLSQNYYSDVELVELHLPSLPELPSHLHTTNGLPHHLMPTLRNAFEMAAPAFFDLLKILHPDLLIYDFIQPWAQSLASSLNIPAVEFITTSASMVSICLHYFTKPTFDFPFPAVKLEDHQIPKLKDFLEYSVNGVSDGEIIKTCIERSSEIILLKSLREIEGKYMDYLSTLSGKKIVPVGALVSHHDSINEDHKQASKGVTEWLDKKNKSSSIFVSFGSEYFLSASKIKEVARGLELSEVNFIWVIRFPSENNKKKLDEALPEGFRERVRERGLLIEGWAPQVEILSHPSTGGFLSHCGWNSLMESLRHGVPIVAMPAHFDQPVNAKLLAEIGVGMEVKRGEDGKVIGAEEMGRVIRQVVVEKRGEGLRKKAREIAELMKKKEEGEFDDVVNEIARIARKGKGVPTYKLTAIKQII